MKSGTGHNDYEVTVTFKMSASSDDSVYDTISLMLGSEDLWDLEIYVDQLTWAPVMEDLE